MQSVPQLILANCPQMMQSLRQDEGYFYPGTIDPWLATAIGLGTASLITAIIAINKANDAKDAANASP